MKGYRTLLINALIIVTAFCGFLVDMFDAGTASGLVLGALTNIGLRTQTTGQIGSTR